jgi:hypothetical protein
MAAHRRIVRRARPPAAAALGALAGLASLVLGCGPPPPRCPATPTPLSFGGVLVDTGPATVLETLVDGQEAVVSFDTASDALFVRFPLVDGAPLLAPDPGDAEIRITDHTAVCTGCRASSIGLHQNGRYVFEVGADIRHDIDGRSAGDRAIHFSGVFPAEGEACTDRVEEDARPASLVVHTDEGDRGLSPGEADVFTIDDAPWQVTAGRAYRRDFRVWPTLATVDGGFRPGHHVITYAEAVAYRIDTR